MSYADTVPAGLVWPPHRAPALAIGTTPPPTTSGDGNTITITVTQGHFAVGTG